MISIGSGTISDWTIEQTPSGFGSLQYDIRQNVCADRVNTATFYLYNITYGLFRTTNGGVLTGTLVGSFNRRTIGFGGHSLVLSHTPYSVAVEAIIGGHRIESVEVAA